MCLTKINKTIFPARVLVLLAVVCVIGQAQHAYGFAEQPQEAKATAVTQQHPKDSDPAHLESQRKKAWVPTPQYPESDYYSNEYRKDGYGDYYKDKHPSCAPLGAVCQTDLQCCSNLCSNGVCAQRCTGKPCRVSHGTFSCDPTTLPGNNCTATCAEGYSGSPVATCQPDGTWSEVQGDCQLNLCVGPPPDNGAFFLCGTINAPGSVCSGLCITGLALVFSSSTCLPSGRWSQPLENCTGDIPCFSGDTLVRVSDSQTPIHIRDLKTGQSVQCVDSGADLTKPGAVKWCEVKNWLHAEAGEVQQTRVSFRRASGAADSITTSANHLTLRLTSGAAVGDTKSTVTAFGSFETVAAARLKRGDRLVVLRNPALASTGFEAVEVEAVTTLVAEGRYVPAIEMPYIIADGVVAPLYVDPLVTVQAPSGVYGANNIALHYAASSAWMTAQQPKRTPGTNGGWNGSPLWPGANKLNSIMVPHLRAGNKLNFAAAQDWFLPQYTAWQANPSDAITLDATVAYFGSNQPWIAGP